ncbi:MAG: hypothetical protein K6A65_06735, partial [Succinivibrionaceae bacterium]|nr:hypothetical protein [Succinivibrionaceae bacterium]
MENSIADILHTDRNISLEQFTDLAAQSRDGQELRLRKSDGSLTNTPLGLIASTGRTRIMSNAIANHAFVQALMKSERYRLVADKIAETLDRCMPANRPLTPERIRSAMGIADQLLAARSLTQQATIEGLLPTPQLQRRFESFAGRYLVQHHEIKLDLGDLGDESRLSAEQRALPLAQRAERLHALDQARLDQATSLMIEFFSHGENLRETGAFRMQAKDCGGSQEKADIITRLINRNSPMHTDHGHRDLLEHILHRSAPQGGPLLGHLTDAFATYFRGKARDFNQDHDGQHLLSRLSERDLRSIEVAIDRNCRTMEARTRALNTICSNLDKFMARGGDLATPRNLSTLTERLIGTLASAPGSYQALAAAREDFLIECLTEGGSLEHDGHPVLGQDGVGAAEGKAALRSPQFLARAHAALQGLGANPTAEETKAAVASAASAFLGEIAPTLRHLEGQGAPVAQPLREAAIGAALAMGQMLGAMRQEGSMGQQFLQSLKALSARLQAPGMTDAGRGQLLSAALAMLPAADDLGPLLRARRTEIGELAGGLAHVANDQRQDAAARALAHNLNEAGLAVYSRMVQALGLSDEEQQAMALPPPPPGPAHPA